MLNYRGKAFRFGKDINTDYIISSRRKRDTIDPEELAPYLMEDIRPGFFGELSGVSILAADENFGCGSAMEAAAQVVRAAGIPVILAKSFARSYYRNAVNNGILIVEMDTDGIREGDDVEVTMDGDVITVRNHTTGKTWERPGFHGEAGRILDHGGIVPYMIYKKRMLRREENE